MGMGMGGVDATDQHHQVGVDVMLAKARHVENVSAASRA